jgi:hypothetical protein
LHIYAKLLSEILKERDLLVNLSAVKRLLIKSVLKKEVGGEMCSKLVWLRILVDGGLL